MEVGIAEDHIALVENGQIIEFKDGQMKLGGRIPGGYVFVDGSGVGDVDRSIVREREILSQDGFVLLNLTIDKRSSALLDSEIISRGFMSGADSAALFEEIKKKIQRLVKQSNGNMQKDVQNLVKSVVFDETKRRPVVFVTISRN